MQISSRQIFSHVIRRSQSSRSHFPPNFLQSRNEFFGFFEIKNQFVFFFFKWKLFFFLNFKFRVFNFFFKKKKRAALPFFFVSIDAAKFGGASRTAIFGRLPVAALAHAPQRSLPFELSRRQIKFLLNKKMNLIPKKKLNLILWKIPKKFGLNELN